MLQEIIEKAKLLGKFYTDMGYDPADANEEIRELTLLSTHDNVSPEEYEEFERWAINAFDEGFGS